MTKIYFFVGHIASGHRSLAGDIMEVLRSHHTSKNILIKNLGKDQTVTEYSTTPPNSILFEIANIISYNNNVEALVFTGWQILENIQAIYDQYSDTAIFLFVKTGTEQALKEYSRPKLRFLTTEEITNTLAQQTNDLEQFFIDADLTPKWQYVLTEQPFNADLSPNITSTPSSQMVSILGSL
jgi:hypothetical protein